MKKTIEFIANGPLKEIYDGAKDFSLLREGFQEDLDIKDREHIEFISNHEFIIKNFKLSDAVSDPDLPEFDFGDITVTSEVTGINEVTWTLDKLGSIVIRLKEIEGDEDNTKVKIVASLEPKYGIMKNTILKGLWLMIPEGLVQKWFEGNNSNE